MGYNLVVMLAIYNILEHSLCSILRFLRAYQLALCTPKMLYMIGGDLVSDASAHILSLAVRWLVLYALHVNVVLRYIVRLSYFHEADYW